MPAEEIIVRKEYSTFFFCVQFCASQYKREMKLLEGVQQRATDMVKVLECIWESWDCSAWRKGLEESHQCV